MESSKISGVSEECQSSESGWTRYICSSIHHDDDDDSMASDASSGPRNREKECENCEEGEGMADSAYQEDKQHSASENGKKEVKKKNCEEKKEESVESGNKVRKNTWIGKRN